MAFKLSPLFQLIRSVENYVNVSDDETTNIFYNIDFIEKLRSVLNDIIVDEYFVNYMDTDQFQSSNNLNSFYYASSSLKLTFISALVTFFIH